MKLCIAIAATIGLMTIVYFVTDWLFDPGHADAAEHVLSGIQLSAVAMAGLAMVLSILTILNRRGP